MLRWNKQTVIDYHVTFNSEHGKRVLNDLRKRCPFLCDTINTANGIDVNKLLYLEGQRSMLLHVYRMLKRDPNEEVPTKAINRNKVGESQNA